MKLTKYSLHIFIGLLVWAGCDQAQQPQPINFLVIFSDEIVPEYLDLYGGKIKTKHLAQLARDGQLYKNAYTTAAMCTPSRYSVLTGNYPGNNPSPYFTEDIAPSEPYSVGWNTYLDSSQATISKVLGHNGYLTAMSGKWHLKSTPRERGFERYFGHLSGATNFFTGDDTFRLDDQPFKVPEKGF